MNHDLEEDQKALEEWAKAERARKSSWENVVLTHKRKRYVRGQKAVKHYTDVYLRIRQSELKFTEMQLAEWRAAVDAASGVASDARQLLCPQTLNPQNLKVQSPNKA